MRSRWITLSLVAWFCGVCVPASVVGQDFGLVTGEVRIVKLNAQGREVSNEAAKGQKVHFFTKLRHLGTRTDDKGAFSYRLGQGDWKVKAEIAGYEQRLNYTVDVSAERKASYPIIPFSLVEVFGRGPASGIGPPVRLNLILYRQEAIEGDSFTGRQSLNLQSNLCEPGKIGWRGRVVDKRAKGIGGAEVVALGARKDSELLVPLGSKVTDKEGNYKVCFRPTRDVTNYVLSITLSGYKDFLNLLLDGEAPPEIVTLEEGSTATQQPLLEKSEATRRHVFTSRVLETLPVSGLRSFDTFALLAPGVAPPPETPNARGPGVSPGLGTAGQFSANGLRSRENNFTVDGSDNNDEDIGTRRQGFVALAPQSLESLSEFQIITALGDARFGRNIGGQVNALTKSGATGLHGSVYGLFTDNVLTARDFFDQDRRQGNSPSSFELRRQSDGAAVLLDGLPIVTPNPVGGENPLRRTQLGLSAGGLITKFGAPFFVSLERLKVRASRESHFIVPTVEQRGIFEAGATGLLFDGPPPPLPAPVQLYADSAPGDAIYSLYPFPNNPLGPFGLNTYTKVLPADAQATRLSAKLEHQFGQAAINKGRRPWSFFSYGDTLTGRYNFSQETSIVPVTGEALYSSLRPKVRTQNLAFYLNRRLTDRISDVIRFSFGRTRLTFGEVRDTALLPSSFFPGEPFLLNAPLLLNVSAPLANGTLTPPSYLSASSSQGKALLASLGYAGFTQAEQIAGALGQVVIPGFSPLGVDVNHFPQSRANNAFQAADTVTFASGKNLISTFGVEMRKIQINSTLDRNFRPLAVFSGLRTSTESVEMFSHLPGGPPLNPRVYSGTTLAAAGVPTGLFQTLAANANSTVGIRFTPWSFFSQFDWRAKSNLTLNLGARVNTLTRLHTHNGTVERNFDSAELQRQAQTAVADCTKLSGAPPLCEKVAAAIVAAFPVDFKTAFESDRFDLDVRTGVAWSLNDKTVIRGGLGTYSGEFPGIVLGESRNAFPDFLPLNFASFPYTSNLGLLFNPANPILRQSEPRLIVAANTLNTLPSNVNAISLLTSRVVLSSANQPFTSNILGVDLVLPNNLRTPYSLQYAVTLERQLGATYGLSLAYVGTWGNKLLRIATPDRGLNRSALEEPPGLKVIPLGNTPVPLFGGGLLAAQSSISITRLAIARTFYESTASSNYNSLQVELRKNYSQRFQFRTAFTYSHAVDDVSDFFDTAGAFALPQNSLQRSERAAANFDVRLRSVTHFVRDFPKDLFFFGPARWGGWQLAGIVTAQTGQPYTVNSSFDINRDGNLTDRLNTTSGLIKGDGQVQLSLAPGTNPLDLLAPDGRDGAVGRNTFRAPGQFNSDISVTKFFNFNERFRLNARTEIFNVFNNTNFGIPVRILESPGFGRATYTTTPPRTVQFVVKFLF